MVRPSLRRALAVVLLASSHSSCNPLATKACTLIGCENGLSVRLDPGAALPYTVTAAWADGRASFTCSRDGAGARAAPSYAFSVQCWNETTFFIACSAPELQSLCRASEVELAVVPSDGPARRARVPLRFTPMYPNGQDCDRDPVCRQASVQVP